MKKTDMISLRSMLRYISTSRLDVQAEVLRLDEVLARLITPTIKEARNDKP